MLVKLIKKKWMIWVLLLLPAIIFLPQPIFEGRVGAKLWSKELKISGFISVSLLFASLILSPLVKLFPKISLFKALSRHRREIGLMLFFYVCYHFFTYLLKAYFKKGYIPFPKFLHPVILPGLLAFLLMIPLAVTSNAYSMRKMGWEKWKRLHRFIYLSEALIFFHMALQGGKILAWAFVFFLPLLFFQVLRINTKQ